MTIPFTPPVFATPIINPRIGGFIKPFPYISVSQYRYAPTAMDTDSLVTVDDATSQDQVQALFNTIYRVSGWIDRYLFGALEAANGASLCASLNTEDAMVLVMQGFYNLQCRYGPILELNGCNVGANPAQTQPVDPSIAAQSVFGIRTIKLPASATSFGSNRGPQLVTNPRGPNGKTYVVWTYTNGFPHTQLAADATAGDTQIDVVPNGPNSGLLGVLPGLNLTIDDSSYAEPIIVDEAVGTTLHLDSPLQYDHTVPAAPDWTPVTALPGDVTQAAIFLTTALIKTRGDLSLELADITEAKETQPTADAVTQDVKYALALLDDFRTISRQRS